MASEEVALQAATTLTVCLGVGVLAVIGSHLAARRFLLPAVVLEILGGIVVGPDVLGLAHDNVIVSAFSELGLAMLMFLAGYEVQLPEIKGAPLRSAVVGWAASFVIGVSAGIALVGLLDREGGTTTGVLVGLVFTTTALGTVLPILRDSGDLATPFGTYVLAAGAVGEFGPILAIALLLSGETLVHTLVVLAIFALATGGLAAYAVRGPSPWLGRLLGATLGTSGQLGVRVVMLVVLALVWLAAELGLDILLGAFAAGLLLRVYLTGQDHEVEHGTILRVEGAGFGFLVPVFFVVSGIRFDLAGLVGDPTSLLIVPVALLLFLVIRGAPAYVALGGSMSGGDRTGAAVYIATALPLVVVITSLGVERGELAGPTAAALVAAGIISVLAFPLTATRLRGVSGPATPEGWTSDSDTL